VGSRLRLRQRAGDPVEPGWRGVGGVHVEDRHRQHPRTATAQPRTHRSHGHSHGTATGTAQSRAQHRHGHSASHSAVTARWWRWPSHHVHHARAARRGRHVPFPLKPFRSSRPRRRPTVTSLPRLQHCAPAVLPLVMRWRRWYVLADVRFAVL